VRGGILLTRVVIHVGPSKTGTTTIQQFLSTNREELLRAGIFYPRTVPDSNEGHPSLAWNILRDLKKPVAYLSKAYVSWESALGGAHSSGAHTLLISSEDFSLEDFDEPAWQRVLGLVGHLDVKVLFGLRDPTSIVIGMWKQAVVWGVGLGEEILSLDQAIPLIGKRRRIQVKPFADLMQRCVPSATFSYFSVPKQKDTNVLLARFCDAAGLPDEIRRLARHEPNAILNSSVSDRYIAVLLRLNILLYNADPEGYRYPANGDYWKLRARKSVLDALAGHELGPAPMDAALSERSSKLLADLQSSVSDWAASQALCGTLDDLRSDLPISALTERNASASADATLVTLAVQALQTHILSTSEQIAGLQGYLAEVEQARDWWRQQAESWQKVAENTPHPGAAARPPGASAQI
jgi:hypothetical protein